MGIGSMGTMELLLVVLVVALIVYVYGRIWSKAGYPGWAGVLMIIPIVNLLAILYLAFAKWPVEEELERLRNERVGL